MEIKIGERASLQISRQGQWVVLFVDDGVSKATLSLDPIKAMDAAKLINGAAITAAQSRIAHPRATVQALQRARIFHR